MPCKPLILASVLRSLTALYGEAPLERASDTTSFKKDSDSST